jgi:hypothetical protein
MISSSDCISDCIIVFIVIVDGLVDKHTEQVFPKDEFTEFMISYKLLAAPRKGFYLATFFSI